MVKMAELGLVYDCQIRKSEAGERTVAIQMTVTAPGCGMGEILLEDVREKAQKLAVDA